MSLIKKIGKNLLFVGVSLAVLSGCAGTRKVNLPNGYSTKFGAVHYLDAISRMYCKGFPVMRLTEDGINLYFPIQNRSAQKCFATAIESADTDEDSNITVKEAKNLYEATKEFYGETTE